MSAAPHPDDLAVDAFAAELKKKMASSRAKGRSGWDDPDQCPPERLASMLVEHLSKANPGTFEDVALFAMMLHQRNDDPSHLPKALRNWARDLDGAPVSLLSGKRVMGEEASPVTSEEPYNEMWNALIDFCIECDEPATFLRNWREGDWKRCRDEWPDVPDSLFPAEALAEFRDD